MGVGAPGSSLGSETACCVWGCCGTRSLWVPSLSVPFHHSPCQWSPMSVDTLWNYICVCVCVRVRVRARARVGLSISGDDFIDSFYQRSRQEAFTLVQMLWLKGAVGRGSSEFSVEYVWAGFVRKMLSFSCPLSACFVSTNHNQTFVCSLLWGL